jgi:hypothetical protein
MTHGRLLDLFPGSWTTITQTPSGIKYNYYERPLDSVLQSANSNFL